MRSTLRATYLRVLIALMTIASSAFVLEAGHRWHY
jgi:hypothetical protein